VVSQIRRALDTRALGHAGTLDPFATGLLVVLVGRATRLARFVERQEKQYLAEAVFGASTTTDDATGDLLRETSPAGWPSREAMKALLAGFEGTGLQRPPAYSARRVEGKRAYRLARRGVEVELPATPVMIATLELVDWDPPRLVFRAVVSAGTYLRALARDLGDRLGVGAHLTRLRRERIGIWRVEQAVAPERVTRASPLLSPLELVGALPAVAIDGDQVGAVRQGRALSAPHASGEVALVAEGRLVAVAEGRDGAWRPRVVLESA
jgi:tRNA pseudouridine55 synthase